MRAGFYTFRRLNDFLDAFDLIKHLAETLLISVLLGNRKLFGYLVMKLFDF